MAWRRRAGEYYYGGTRIVDQSYSDGMLMNDTERKLRQGQVRDFAINIENTLKTLSSFKTDKTLMSDIFDRLRTLEQKEFSYMNDGYGKYLSHNEKDFPFLGDDYIAVRIKMELVRSNFL